MTKQIARRTQLEFIALALTSCMCVLNAACTSAVQSDPLPPALKVANSLDSATDYIKSVSLVGYEFTNLRIYSGSSQVFSLDAGMPGGFTGIHISVRYGVATATWTVSNAFDFSNSETTTVTLLGSSAEGHSDYNNYRLE